MSWTKFKQKDEGSVTGAKIISFSNDVFEHKITLTGATSLTLNASDVTPTFFQRRLRIVMPATVVSVTFPASVVWNRGFAPCMNVPSQEYIIELETYNGGTSWCGSWVCEMEA